MCWIQNKKDKFILIAESIEKMLSVLFVGKPHQKSIQYISEKFRTF